MHGTMHGTMQELPRALQWLREELLPEHAWPLLARAFPHLLTGSHLLPHLDPTSDQPPGGHGGCAPPSGGDARAAIRVSEAFVVRLLPSNRWSPVLPAPATASPRPVEPPPPLPPPPLGAQCAPVHSAQCAHRTAHRARRTAHGARRTAHGARRTAHGLRADTACALCR